MWAVVRVKIRVVSLKVIAMSGASFFYDVLSIAYQNQHLNSLIFLILCLYDVFLWYNEIYYRIMIYCQQM